MAPRRKRSAKNQPQPQPQPGAESVEEFRLSDVQSDSDISVNLPSGSVPVRRPPGPTNYLSGLNWHPDPDPEDAAVDDKSTAADIHYFFAKTKEGAICRVCK
jgi:hypothetical protein